MPHLLFSYQTIPHIRACLTSLEKREYNPRPAGQKGMHSRKTSSCLLHVTIPCISTATKHQRRSWKCDEMVFLARWNSWRSTEQLRWLQCYGNERLSYDRVSWDLICWNALDVFLLSNQKLLVIPEFKVFHDGNSCMWLIFLPFIFCFQVSFALTR